MKKGSKLTPKEHEVLQVLWNSGEALTSSEIVARSEGMSWKPSYIHLLINSLLDKKMVRVTGMRPTTKNYARTFEPTITQEEYTASLLREQKASTKSLTTVFAALVEEETDKDLIDELSKMLKDRRKELDEAAKKVENKQGESETGAG